ncbi:MAG: MerR family transcriptional regulator [Nocardioides sp.]|uniref:MerR family transcriptional regulator n=1 Tax=Nocardioides sp. TaxID=35761 RepID=UPI003F058858
MLTIGQLAAYAGVTPRAVRHYHQIGLLPEPERDASGYRSYDAQAVIGLVRIRVLAEAGVPLARVQELLDAGEDEFAAAVTEIDRRLRAEIRELTEHRRRIARLAAGDSLALPPVVVAYLDRMRELGVPELVVRGERDGWILLAARMPDQMDEFMADKMAQLDDPRTVELYRLFGDILENGDNGQLDRAADLLVTMVEEAEQRGDLDRQVSGDDAFFALVDAFASSSHPMIERLQVILAERGWRGWSRMERAE